jgi:vacuolar-type H+-ATPase subunit E/Vma4
MSGSNHEDNNEETLAYLLGVIEANREQHCTKLREAASVKRKEIIKQAHSQVRARMSHHVLTLREKYRERITAADARNQTLIRRQHQAADKVLLDEAWPMLEQALHSLWETHSSRKQWISQAVETAASTFIGENWVFEHPADLAEEDRKYLISRIKEMGKEVELRVNEDIKVGVRVSVDGTCLDATREGLLKQKVAIEAMLISRTRQDVS